MRYGRIKFLVTIIFYSCFTNSLNANKNYFHSIPIRFLLTVILASVTTFSVITQVEPVYSSFSFNTKLNVTNADGLVSSPQIVVAGANSYMTWNNHTTGISQVTLARSTNDGLSYPLQHDISKSVNDSQDSQISVFGNDVYVVWQEVNVKNQIFFSRSIDNGASFSPPQNLTSPSIDSTGPQIAASGNNVYVIWNGFTTASEIFFSRSIDNGASFSPPQNLTSPIIGSGGGRIVASGDNVYVAWVSLTTSNEVFFNQSTDNGTSFSPAQNISNNTGDSISPEIGASENYVHVTWQDNISGFYQIYIKDSNNSGSTFLPVKQLSNTVGDSTSPMISVSGTNVYAVWQGDPGSGLPEVYFRSSMTGGQTFNGTINLSSNSGDSFTPEIASSDSNVYVTWIDDTVGNFDVFFKASSDHGSHFGGFRNISNSPSKDSFDPVIASSTSHAYVSWQDLDPVTSKGDIFVVSGSGVISSDITFNSTEYKINQLATIRVISPASNATGATIDVNVTSTSDPNGISVTLPETDPTTANFTGIINFHTGPSNSLNQTLNVAPGDIITTSFGGEEGAALIFPRIVQFDHTSYTQDKHPIITITDQNSNIDPFANDTASFVKVNSTSDPTGIVFNIPETNLDTGIFTKQINIVQDNSSALTYSILAKVGDTITTWFNGKSTDAQISPPISRGGGGGGFIKPGLVLDAAAGAGFIPSDILKLIQNLDPSKIITASQDCGIDCPFSIDGKGYPLAFYSNKVMLNTVSTGKPIQIDFVFFSSLNIIHVGVFFDLHGGGDLQDSDTYIIYDKGSPLQVVDPQGFIQDVNFTSTKNDTKNKFMFLVTFAKPMKKSDIFVSDWDVSRHVSNTKILDTIEVINSRNNELNNDTSTSANIVPPESNPELTKESTRDLLPLIKEWAGYSPSSISDSELLADIGLGGNHIPIWLMGTARWLVDGQITQEEFVNSLKYLSENGIIK